MSPLIRIILVYGLIAGACATVPMLVGMKLWGAANHAPVSPAMISNLSMVAAALVIFFGMRAYRTRVGGTVTFAPVLVAGLGVGAVAALVFALGIQMSDAIAGVDPAREVSEMTARSIAEQEAAGASPERIAELKARAKEFVAAFSNPLMRAASAYLFLFLIGAVVSLISAALLISPGFFPSGWRPKFKRPRWMGPGRTG